LKENMCPPQRTNARSLGAKGRRQTCGETDTKLIFIIVYNDLRGIGLPAGLIWGLNPCWHWLSALSYTQVGRTGLRGIGAVALS
jgi:hypothetical protein